eukprot:c14557_g1_i1 orf=43-303(+)
MEKFTVNIKIPSGETCYDLSQEETTALHLLKINTYHFCGSSHSKCLASHIPLHRRTSSRMHAYRKISVTFHYSLKYCNLYQSSVVH